MTERALGHLRVIDLTHHVAGPYCTKLLAGFGAEVIKVERPGSGDPLRSMGPFYQGVEGPERSIPFLWLNTGKKSITLDLKLSGDREKLLGLVRQSDVLVENFRPGVMERLGLTWEVLREVNPRLVMTSISNFGQHGPYRDFRAEEIQCYAMSGQMYLTGLPDTFPLAPGPSACQYLAGAHAYIATLMAFLLCRETGCGQHVDVSIQETCIETIEMPPLINFLHKGVVANRAKHIMVPWDLFPCRNGWAAVIGAPFRNWDRGAELFGQPELFADKYHHCRDRMQYRAEIEALLLPWLATQDKEDVFLAGQERGLAFGFLADFSEVLALEQHRARDFFSSIDHPVVGRHVYCGAPFRLSSTPWRQLRAPLLGEHNGEILAGGLRQREGISVGRCGGSGERLPLEGIRIIDLTHSWAGPHSTRLLADFGAEVIRIEYVRRLCPLRGGKTEDQMYEKHPMWFQVNRNKRSVTLDLTREKDRRVLKELVAVADVVIENSRTGVLDRFGLNYRVFSELKPDILMLSMPAFGCTGPWAAFAGYGATIEALSGIQSLTGYEPGGKPFRIKEMDISTGVMAACAVITGLVYRQQTGRGQHIDFSQLEAITHANIGEHLLEFVMNGNQRPIMGNRHPRYAPRGCYPCKGEDRWLVISIAGNEEWQRFCRACGLEHLLEDPRFADHEARRRHHDALDEAIAQWSVQQEHRQAMTMLQAQGIAAAAVLDVSDLAVDPHLAARDYLVQDVPGSDAPFPGMPFRLSLGAGTIRWQGPCLGRDNRYVLTELLGHPEEEVEPVNEEDIGTAFDPE